MSAVTLSYDGTNWTAEESLSTARRDLAGSGTATAGLGTAGYTNPPSTRYTNTEEYGGESWTAGGSLLVATRAGQSSGTQTDAIFLVEILQLQLLLLSDMMEHLGQQDHQFVNRSGTNVGAGARKICLQLQ